MLAIATFTLSMETLSNDLMILIPGSVSLIQRNNGCSVLVTSTATVSAYHDIPFGHGCAQLPLVVLRGSLL